MFTSIYFWMCNFPINHYVCLSVCLIGKCRLLLLLKTSYKILFPTLKTKSKIKEIRININIINETFLKYLISLPQRVKGETLLHFLGNHVDFSSPLTGESNIMSHYLEIKGKKDWNTFLYMPESNSTYVFILVLKRAERGSKSLGDMSYKVSYRLVGSWENTGFCMWGPNMGGSK